MIRHRGCGGVARRGHLGCQHDVEAPPVAEARQRVAQSLFLGIGQVALQPLDLPLRVFEVHLQVGGAVAHLVVLHHQVGDDGPHLFGLQALLQLALGLAQHTAEIGVGFGMGLQQAQHLGDFADDGLFARGCSVLGQAGGLAHARRFQRRACRVTASHTVLSSTAVSSSVTAASSSARA